jgi:hypothetical protein
MKQRVLFLFPLLGSITLLARSAPTSDVSSPAAAADSPPPIALPAPEAIPLLAEYQYRLSGGARPFVVFWINRDNVGGGRMTWRRAADGTLSLELLTGSDPARAPFHTNRWGYVREVVRGQDAELIAVKSDIEEETIEQARAGVKRQNDRLIEFIRERVTARDAHSWSAVEDIERDGVSYRDLEFVLGHLSSVASWQERHLEKRPPDARSGFLVAFTELMRAGVEQLRTGQARDGHPDPIAYIHRAKLYELRQANIELRQNLDLGGRRYARALQSRFQIRNAATGETSPFTVTYGADGALAAVPLQLAYQPRWWLRTELTLDDTLNFSPDATVAPHP